MIVDQVKNYNIYCPLSANVKTGLEFIYSLKNTSIEIGKHTIEGDNVFALVSEYITQPKAEVKWEAHQKYIDIQMLLVGEENMGYTSREFLTETQIYSLEKDIAFYSGTGNYIPLIPGNFIILFPRDAHQPGTILTTQTFVKKVVIKVAV